MRLCSNVPGQFAIQTASGTEGVPVGGSYSAATATSKRYTSEAVSAGCPALTSQ